MTLKDNKETVLKSFMSINSTTLKTSLREGNKIH